MIEQEVARRLALLSHGSREHDMPLRVQREARVSLSLLVRLRSRLVTRSREREIERERRRKRKSKEKKIQPPSSHFPFSKKSLRGHFFPSASLPSGTSRAPPRSSNSPHSGREHALRRLCVEAQRSETQEGLRAGAPSDDGFVALSRNASRERKRRVSAV